MTYFTTKIYDIWVHEPFGALTPKTEEAVNSGLHLSTQHCECVGRIAYGTAFQAELSDLCWDVVGGKLRDVEFRL